MTCISLLWMASMPVCEHWRVAMIPFMNHHALLATEAWVLSPKTLVVNMLYILVKSLTEGRVEAESGEWNVAHAAVIVGNSWFSVYSLTPGHNGHVHAVVPEQHCFHAKITTYKTGHENFFWLRRTCRRCKLTKKWLFYSDGQRNFLIKEIGSWENLPISFANGN